MGDIRLKYDPATMGFDIGVAAGDLEADDGLETAVIISLFTDRRAEDDDTPPGAPDDRRGWWADQFLAQPGDRIGSRLWLLAREKERAAVLPRAKEYAEEALAWMVADGIARSVTVTPEIMHPGVLALGIEIARANAPAARYRFETFWKPQ